PPRRSSRHAHRLECYPPRRGRSGRIQGTPAAPGSPFSLAGGQSGPRDLARSAGLAPPERESQSRGWDDPEPAPLSSVRRSAARDRPAAAAGDTSAALAESRAQGSSSVAYARVGRRDEDGGGGRGGQDLFVAWT